jgi:RHS repeat-associated protein
MIQTRYEFGDDLYSQVRWGEATLPPPGEGACPPLEEGGGEGAVLGEGDVSYFLYDGLGSTRSLTNASGAIVQSYNYRPFGEGIDHPGELATNHLFTGEYYDSNLDYYYLRARYYSPGLGRFTGYDPVEDANNKLHKYVYCGNDGVMQVDLGGCMLMSIEIASVLSFITQSQSISRTIIRPINYLVSAERAMSLYMSQIARFSLEEPQMDHWIWWTNPTHPKFELMHMPDNRAFFDMDDKEDSSTARDIRSNHAKVDSIWLAAKEIVRAFHPPYDPRPNYSNDEWTRNLFCVCIVTVNSWNARRDIRMPRRNPGIMARDDTLHHFFWCMFFLRLLWLQIV